MPGSGTTVRAVAVSPSNPNVAYVSYKNLQEGFFFETISRAWREPATGARAGNWCGRSRLSQRLTSTRRG